jgi:hypothetical protein
MTCEAAKQAIEARRFTGWRGMPSSCTAEALFGKKLDDEWGSRPLGASFEKARSRVLELAGYDSALGYVREDHAVLFDGMNPQLDGGWPALATDLGKAESTLDWVAGTIAMPKGELVYASRGITIFLNPENNWVFYVTVYAPTTVEDYAKRLRPAREKRPLPK